MNRKQTNNEMCRYTSLNGKINHDTRNIHTPIRHDISKISTMRSQLKTKTNAR